MLGFIKHYFGYYYLLFFASFCSIFFFQEITPILNASILICSYYLILTKSRFEVVLILALYSRCLCGFVFFHDSIVYNVINFLCNGLPLFIYIISTVDLNLKLGTNKKIVFSEYKYTWAFFLVLTIYFILYFDISQDLITKRYLPLSYFIIFLFFFKRDADFDIVRFLRFFRSTFLASLVVYFLSDYSKIAQELLQSDLIFNVKSDEYSLIFFSIFRNMGIFWDHRILSIFCYLFLMLSIVSKSKYISVDIILSLILISTTTARGGIITYLLILLAYLFINQRKIFIYTAFILCFIIVFGSVLFFANDDVQSFLLTFNLFNEDNALSQRGGFVEYALNQFYENPFTGNGVGFVSSASINRSVNVGDTTYSTVTDAFWFSLLAEMGLLGWGLFMLSYLEIFFFKNIINLALLIGVCIQLTGTDIPDMRFYYFVFLVVAFFLSKHFRAVQSPMLIDQK